MDDTAVAALRRARRRNRLQHVDRFEAFYRAYVVVLLSAVAAGVAAELVGGTEVAPAAAAEAVRHGPAALGLVAAVAVVLGVRSGGRGGPLGVEQADVRHLLLAPVSRRTVLGPLVARQLRSAMAAAAAFGVVAGMLASRRLPGDMVVWATAGAAFAVATAALTLGAAYAVSGWRVHRAAASAAGLAVVAWSAADVWLRSRTSPLTGMGEVVVVAMGDMAGGINQGRAAAAAAVVLAVVAMGLAAAPGVSVEAAERRSKLVGEIRFAATVQDIRTVLVLQRQLSQDRPRARPWLALPGRGGRLPTWRRDWHGLLRWRAPRLARVAALGAVAGLAAVPVRAGTLAFIGVAGAALWLAALDVAEPVAQEVDHPALLDSLPRRTGLVLLAHVPASMVAMSAPAAIAVAVTGAVEDVGVAVVGVIGGAVCAVAGAVVTLVKGPPPPFDPVDFMIGPEMAAMRRFQRLVLPVVVATIGTGVLVSPTVATAAFTVAATVVVAALLAVWLGFLNKSMSAT